MSRRHFRTFWTCLFLGLFFCFGVIFGIDPTDVYGTVAAEIVHGFFPQVDPLVTVAGIILSVLTFLGFVVLVRSKWDDDKVDGFASFFGFLAGALTLIWVEGSFVFWIGGIVASVL